MNVFFRHPYEGHPAQVNDVPMGMPLGGLMEILSRRLYDGSQSEQPNAIAVFLPFGDFGDDADAQQGQELLQEVTNRVQVNSENAPPNPFQPFQGMPNRLGEETVEQKGGETKPEDVLLSQKDDDEDEDESVPEPPVVLPPKTTTRTSLNSRTRHTVGEVQVKLENETEVKYYTYYYPKTFTWKKLCEAILEKTGLKVSCFGCGDGDADFKLCWGYSELTSYETITSFVAQPDIETRPFQLVPVHDLGGGRSVLRNALKEGTTASEKSQKKKQTLDQKVQDYKNAMASKTFQCDILKNTKSISDFLHGVPDHQSAEVFKRAFQKMVSDNNRSDLETCLIALNPENKSFASTELRLEEVFKTIMKQTFKTLDDQVKEVETLKSSIMVKMLAHYANIGMKSGRYDTSVMHDLIREHLQKLTRASGSTDVNMEALTDMMGKVSAEACSSLYSRTLP